MRSVPPTGVPALRRAPASLVLVASLLLASAAVAAGPPPPPSDDAPASFLEEARRLARVVACTEPRGPLPAGVTAAELRRHCASLRAAMDRYDKRWLSRARPFFEELVPAGLPDRVVYPFGGADLTNALAVFPDAAEITTLSLEYVGDPRAVDELRGAALASSLKHHRDFIIKLVAVNHNRTIDLAVLDADPLPSPLVFALVGLGIHQRELLDVRYFDVLDDGGLRYLTPGQIAAADAAIEARHRTPEAQVQARKQLFANVEVRFRRAGEADAPVQVFRHIRANLADDHLERRPGILAHLEAKGRVTAMTKAASYLLWRDAFASIRDYLLGNMAWMISDSTGPTPYDAEAAGFEQIVWGRFHSVAFSGPRKGEIAMRELFAAQPHRSLPVFFGYTDKDDRAHLVVTRPRTIAPAH